MMGMESSLSGSVSSSSVLVAVPAGSGGSAGCGEGFRAGGGGNFGQETDSRFWDQHIRTNNTLGF